MSEHSATDAEVMFVKRETPGKGVPVVAMVRKGRRESVVGRFYGYEGSPDERAAKAQARAKAFVLMPAALKAVKAIAAAFPKGMPEDRAKLKQAQIRAEHVLQNAQEIGDLSEYGGS